MCCVVALLWYCAIVLCWQSGASLRCCVAVLLCWRGYVMFVDVLCGCAGVLWCCVVGAMALGCCVAVSLC